MEQGNLNGNQIRMKSFHIKASVAKEGLHNQQCRIMYKASVFYEQSK